MAFQGKWNADVISFDDNSSDNESKPIYLYNLTIMRRNKSKRKNDLRDIVDAFFNTPVFGGCIWGWSFFVGDEPNKFRIDTDFDPDDPIYI